MIFGKIKQLKSSSEKWDKESNIETKTSCQTKFKSLCLQTPLSKARATKQKVQVILKKCQSQDS